MKPIPTPRRLLAAILLCGLLLGCQTAPLESAGEPPFGSVARIASVSPDVTRELRAGEKVVLRVEVQYVLTAAAGTVELIVLAADNSPLARQTVPVARGRGTASLQAEFTVPLTTTIRVYTPLVYPNQDATANTDGRSYSVVPR